MPDVDPPVIPLASLTNEKIGSGREEEIFSNIELRKKVAGYLLVLFVFTNIAVLITIGGLALVDYQIVNQIVVRATAQPASLEKLLNATEFIDKSRSVNSSVLIALISATAVQVGVGVFTITQYLFPKPKDKSAGK